MAVQGDGSAEHEAEAATEREPRQHLEYRDRDMLEIKSGGEPAPQAHGNGRRRGQDERGDGEEADGGFPQAENGSQQKNTEHAIAQTVDGGEIGHQSVAPMEPKWVRIRRT
jgi:hypothetical protein